MTTDLLIITGPRPAPCALDVSTIISPPVTLAGVTRRIMCSLVEIKNPNEIYIHYMFDNEADETEATSDRGDSIDSVDHTGDAVTINNCAVTRAGVTSSEVAVQVDLSEGEMGNKVAATKGNIINHTATATLPLIANIWFSSAN